MPEKSVEDQQQVQINAPQTIVHIVQLLMKKMQYMHYVPNLSFCLFTFLRRVSRSNAPMSEMLKPTFRQAIPSDTDRCYQIETEAYEGDEAATREKIATRISQYRSKSR